MAVAKTINDFLILGPTVAPGNKVLEAIHALYFLPENYKLLLTDGKNADQPFYNQVRELVKQYKLDERVRFDGDADSTQAVILPNAGHSRVASSVVGDSAEALASAILDVARARA